MPVLGADGVHNVGDLNQNGSLDVAEVWTFQCAMVVTARHGQCRDSLCCSACRSAGAERTQLGVRGCDAADRGRQDRRPSCTLPEPGGLVTFTVAVTNLSPEPVELTTLTDSVYGNLNGKGTCVVPQSIPVSGLYQCQFTATVTGNAGEVHRNVVTAAGAGQREQPGQRPRMTLRSSSRMSRRPSRSSRPPTRPCSWPRANWSPSRSRCATPAWPTV